MSNHNDYIHLYEQKISVKDSASDKVDSKLYDEIGQHEKILDENKDLYEVFHCVNKVLASDEKYQAIQTCSPWMRVNDGEVIINATTKTDEPGTEQILKDFVTDLKKDVSFKKLKYDSAIENVELDGLKKYQMTVTVSR